MALEEAHLSRCPALFRVARRVATHRIFNALVVVAILLNTALLGAYHHGMSESLAADIDRGAAGDALARLTCAPGPRAANIVFTLFFAVETVLKLCGLGLQSYFHDRWNILDLLVRSGRSAFPHTRRQQSA